MTGAAGVTGVAGMTGAAGIIGLSGMKVGGSPHPQSMLQGLAGGIICEQREQGRR